jgi:hypothetical protein
MNRTLILLVGLGLLSTATTGCTPRMAAAGIVGAVIGAAVVSSAHDDHHEYCSHQCDVRHHHRYRMRRVEVHHHHYPATEYEVIYVGEEE